MTQENRDRLAAIRDQCPVHDPEPARIVELGNNREDHHMLCGCVVRVSNTHKPYPTKTAVHHCSYHSTRDAM